MSIRRKRHSPRIVCALSSASARADSSPASDRQRQDMVLLAHIRASFALSNGSYGSPRMTHELRDNGLSVGHRRTARLMRENGLVARQKRRFKRTTGREHT